MNDKLLVTYAEAAEMLSVNARTVRRLVDKGDLDKVYVTPRSPRIPVVSLNRYVAFLPQPCYTSSPEGLAVRAPEPGDGPWPDAQTKMASTRGRTRSSGGRATQTQAARELDALLAPPTARTPRRS